MRFGTPKHPMLVSVLEPFLRPPAKVKIELPSRREPQFHPPGRPRNPPKKRSSFQRAPGPPFLAPGGRRTKKMAEKVSKMTPKRVPLIPGTSPPKASFFPFTSRTPPKPSKSHQKEPQGHTKTPKLIQKDSQKVPEYVYRF